jgi:deoxyribose-phosphate aldolase
VYGLQCLEHATSGLQEEIKRAAAREAARQNLEMAEAKKRNQKLQRERERAGAAAMIKSESGWWNKGAASEQVCSMSRVQVLLPFSRAIFI